MTWRTPSTSRGYQTAEDTLASPLSSSSGTAGGTRLATLRTTRAPRLGSSHQVRHHTTVRTGQEESQRCLPAGEGGELLAVVRSMLALVALDTFDEGLHARRHSRCVPKAAEGDPPGLAAGDRPRSSRVSARVCCEIHQRSRCAPTHSHGCSSTLDVVVAPHASRHTSGHNARSARRSLLVLLVVTLQGLLQMLGVVTMISDQQVSSLDAEKSSIDPRGTSKWPFVMDA